MDLQGVVTSMNVLQCLLIIRASVTGWFYGVFRVLFLVVVFFLAKVDIEKAEKGLLTASQKSGVAAGKIVSNARVLRDQSSQVSSTSGSTNPRGPSTSTALSHNHRR